MTTIHCQAILFDMDGTLVDSTACVEALWHQWAAQQGLDNVEEILAVSHGYRTVDTIRQVAPHLDAAREAELFEIEETNSWSGVEAVKGAVELIASLPPDKWAVVTSAGRALATARLQAAGLPVPAALVPSDEIMNGKPHPEGFLRAAALLGVPVSECLVIEDAPVGLAAAKASGAQVIAISTTYPAEQLPAALCIPDLACVRVTVTDRLTLDIA